MIQSKQKTSRMDQRVSRKFKSNQEEAHDLNENYIKIKSKKPKSVGSDPTNL